jgi:prepilin signal peptidase PulO-like enzyme (type II secretory pathway)
VSDEPLLIEHNGHEKRPTNAIWWALWIIVGLQWVGTAYFFDFNWHQIALGAFTGMLLASWAIDITGNKVPDSWSRRLRK